MRKKIEVGDLSFEVGEVKDVLKYILGEEKQHMDIVEDCLERHYDKHLEKSTSRGGFRKGASFK